VKINIHIDPSAKGLFSLEDKKKARIAIKAALKMVQPKAGEMTLLLSSDEHIHELNKIFREKDKPTDVLSFEGEGGYLGDVIIANSYKDKIQHLAIHGFLHLCGYDHIKAKDAKIMESLEIAILATINIPNPYL
jgi:probable rRNA maturation factor